MNRFKEYMKNMTTQGWITTAFIGALVLIAIIGFSVSLIGHSTYRGMVLKKNTPGVTQHVNSDTDNFINKASTNVFDKNIPANSYSSTNTQVEVKAPTTKPVKAPVTYEAQKHEVKVALIIEQNEYDVKNIIAGVCGNAYLITAYIPGPNVLENSYKALFGDKLFADFLPGNIIPTYHPDLRFKQVVITDGVARIYLTGSFTETQKDSCDKQLAIAQLSETAKSYPNVKSVEIYLGTQIVN